MRVAGILLADGSPKAEARENQVIIFVGEWKVRGGVLRAGDRAVSPQVGKANAESVGADVGAEGP